MKLSCRNDISKLGVSMDSGFGFYGDIDGEPFHANVTWDYEFGQAGHFDVNFYNKMTQSLPSWAHAGPKPDLGPRDTRAIHGPSGTPARYA